jgi:gliding motility-associated-like protein
MKKLYIICLISLINLFIDSSLNAQTAFLVGADLQIRAIDPNNSRLVEVKLIYYRDCSAASRRNPGNAFNQNAVVVFQSTKCCTFLVDTLTLDLAISNKEATPICPTNPAFTTCDGTTSSNPGYKADFYLDTVLLPANCDDWHVGHMWSNSIACQNYLDSNNIKFQTTPAPAGRGRAFFPPPPTPIFGARRPGSNTLPNNPDRTEAGFYIEKTYNNKIDLGGGNFRANSSPRYSANPLIFQCSNKLRTYDLGYYDVDGDVLEFEPITPFKDITKTVGPSGFGNGLAITWNPGFSNIAPLGPTSTYLVNPSTGAITFEANNGVGYYKTAIKITEKDPVTLAVKDISMRDIIITIINTPNCALDNTVGEKSDFIAGYKNLVNCDTAPNRVDMIQTCAGNTMSFDVEAVSKSPIPNASIFIEAEIDTIRMKNASIITSYRPQDYPVFDTGFAKFIWNIPANTPPGIYPVIFTVRDCIDGYILARQKIVYVRVNRKVNLTSEYQGVKLNQITLPVNRTYFCSGGLPPFLSTENGELDAQFTWKDEPTGCATYSTFDQGNKVNSLAFINDITQDCWLIATANQSCNQTDTLFVKKSNSYTPSSSFSSPDSCQSTKGQITISGTPAGTLYDWQKVSGCFDGGVPSKFQNFADMYFCSPTNNFDVFTISPDTCILQTSVTVDTKGIKPLILSLTTDRTNVCPKDTIQVSSVFITPICGEDPYNTIIGSKLYAEYPGEENNPTTLPRIFAGSRNVEYMRTQFIYLASELTENGFKPGKINALAFNIEGISNPRKYNELGLRVKCTDRSSLQDLKYEAKEDMIEVAKINGSTILNVGWNEFNLTKEFSWDGTSNLIFEVTSECVKGDIGATLNVPVMADNQVGYVSTIGSYFNKNEFGWDSETSASTSSNYRPNLKWGYYKFDTTNVKFTWTDQLGNNPSPDLTFDSKDTIFSNPKVSANKRSTYFATLRNGLCVKDTFVVAFYNDSFKIKIDRNFINKCNDDTIQLKTTAGIILPVYYEIKCGASNIQCNVSDSVRKAFAGLTTNVSNFSVSPFGGVANAGTAENTTDKRIQLIITAAELKANLGVDTGLINGISFDMLTKSTNFNVIQNFKIKLKCISKDSSQFSNSVFHQANTFTTVYQNANLTTTTGNNYFAFNKPYGWDGQSNLMLDICWDNPAGKSYLGDAVRASTLLPAVSSNRTLFRASNIGTNFGCDFTTGTRTNVRPNINLHICRPTASPPPLPLNYNWAPNVEISNTQIYNPIVYNTNTRKYYVYLDYMDTTLKKSVCRVSDTVLVKVGRPDVKIAPEKPVACIGSSTDIELSTSAIPAHIYKYRWEPNQQGIAIEDSANSFISISPPNPKYYYLNVYNSQNPNCWARDSVFVDVQNLRTMPQIDGISMICNGDSVSLYIPEQVGYKNPVWYDVNNQPLGNAYKIKVGAAGKYYIKVDSGACRNTSDFKVVEYRKQDTLKMPQYDYTLCQGDTAILYYDISSGLVVPLWSNGYYGVSNKVSTSGQYFIVNARDQFGCPLILQDTANVVVIDNPDFTVGNDTLCLAINQKKTLIPDPLDNNAVYQWDPVRQVSPTLEVSTPGNYTVVRSIGKCTKTATVTVVEERFGQVDLGPDFPVCCDEVSLLDANTLNKKYKSYKWSTGETSQSIFTKPNVSGVYVVEAIRPSGCKDTGSVFVDAKCTNLTAKPERDTIYLGETNDVIGSHLNIKNTYIEYKWMSLQDYNKISKTDMLRGSSYPTDSGDAEYVLLLTLVDTSYNPIKKCSENAVVRYRVLPNIIKIPNVFSPNGDGTNDTYFPFATGLVEVTEFKVYNRQGQLLHDDINKPWDGNFNGQPQPNGVYVCLISYYSQDPRKEKETKYVQVNLTLIR